MEDWRRYLEPNNPKRVYEDGVLYWVWPDGFKLLGVAGGGAAYMVQQTFRFRNDDGSESTATFMGSGNGEDQTIAINTKFRIRFVVQETNGGNGTPEATLYYSYQGGTYTDIATTGDHIRAIASDYDPDPQDDQSLATPRLGFGGTYAAGRFDSDGVAATSVTIDNDSAGVTEFEFCLIIPSGVVEDGQTIDLRVYDSGSPLNSYTDTPRITISAPAADREVNETDGVTVAASPTITPLALEDVVESDDLTVGESTSVGPILLEVNESDGITVGESSSAAPLALADVSISDNITVADSASVSVPVEDIDLSVSDGVTAAEMFFFRDTLESGDLTLWTSSVTDGGDLSVSGDAAMLGSYGMDFWFDGDTNPMYVVKNDLGGLARYRFGYLLDPNSLVMSTNAEHEMAAIYSGATRIFSVYFQWDGTYFNLEYGYKPDGLSIVWGPYLDISDEMAWVEVDCKISDGTDNGHIYIYLNGSVLTSYSGIDNDTYSIDELRLGATVNVDASSLGHYYIDQVCMNAYGGEIDPYGGVRLQLQTPEAVGGDAQLYRRIRQRRSAILRM